jgi:hypothetical protein
LLRGCAWRSKRRDCASASDWLAADWRQSTGKEVAMTLQAFSPSLSSPQRGKVAFEAPANKTAHKRRGFVGRFVDYLIAGRTGRAAEEIKCHSHLLPCELDKVAWKLGERGDDSLPFVR